MIIGYIKAHWLGIVSLTFFGVMLAVQEHYGRPLKTYDVPLGIVSLELARDVDTTQKIFDSWGPTLRNTAIKSVSWDYGFLISYSLLNALACRWAARKMAVRWAWPAAPRVGTFLAAVGFLAAAFDAIENAALLWQLPNSPAWFPAGAAWFCAIVKFALLGVSLCFVGGGVIAASRILNAHARFAVTHTEIMAVPALVFCFILGFLGQGYGIPSLFWNDDALTLLSASCGTTLLLLVVGMIVYYDQRDIGGGFVEEIAGPRRWQPAFVDPTLSENLSHLAKFLQRAGTPYLVLLSLPALFPSFFPYAPNVPFHLEGITFAFWTNYGRLVVWITGIALGIAIAKGLISLSIFTYSNNQDRLPLKRSLVTFYIIFFASYVLLSNWPLYHFVSPAFGICALLTILTMVIAFVSQFTVLFFPVLRGWWINGSFVAGFLLIVIFGVSNYDPYKHVFPKMESYYPAQGGELVDLKSLVEQVYFGQKPSNAIVTVIGPKARLISDIDALEAWRKVAPLPKNERKPRLAVVVVSGGATRSAYWTATVLDRIETRISGFSKNVRIIAGASGGMLGTACYLEELDSRSLKKPPSSFPDCVPTNSIEPLARYIALGEIWRALLPFRTATDRGIELQNDWKTLQKPLQSYLRKEEKGELPSIIFSPMLADDGRRLLISNLDLGALCKAQGGVLTDKPAEHNLNDYSLSAVEFYKLFPKALEFQLATAVRMNATFPFVSPAVNLPCKPPRRVVDAGYYDNFGVQLAAAWIEKNLDWLIDHTSGVVLIQVRDAISRKERLEVADPPQGIFSTIGQGFQFFSSPLDAVSQARYTVNAYRNDQDVANISSRFESRIARIASADSEKTPDEVAALAANFFTTVVFENSAVVTFGSNIQNSWPGDELENIQTSKEVALDWYLSQAERDGLRRAIPTVFRPGETPKIVRDQDEPEPKPPVGSDWSVKENRLKRLDWIRERVAATRGPKHDQWLKELEQARNFERIEELKEWWNLQDEPPVKPQ